MSTISAQLRNFKEHGDEQPLLFFAITPSHAESHGVSQNNTEDDLHKMEILCESGRRGHRRLVRTNYTILYHSVA